MGKAKGDRRERQAREILEDCGYKVETPNYTRYGNTDFYNAFDLIAMHPEEKVKLVQVKSNGATGIRDLASKVQDFVNFKVCDVEYWVCHDNEGWRCLRINEQGNISVSSYETVFDARESDLNMGEYAKDMYRIE